MLPIPVCVEYSTVPHYTKQRLFMFDEVSHFKDRKQGVIFTKMGISAALSDPFRIPLFVLDTRKQRTHILLENGKLIHHHHHGRQYMTNHYYFVLISLKQ